MVYSLLINTTGKNIIEKECLTIETRFYFEDNTYSSSNTQEICFFVHL